MPDELISYSEAFSLLAKKIEESPTFKIGSFEEFLINVFSQSFDKPDWFSTWHVKYMAEKVEEAWENHKDLVCKAARGHLKTSVLGQGFPLWLFLKTLKDSRSLSGMYMGYIEPLAQIKLRELKNIILRNEQLKEWFKDTEPDSQYLCRFKVGNKPCEISPSGVFTAKRGLHTNRFYIGDDLLKDPQNPLNLSQLEKIKTRFYGEFYNIPQGDHIIRIIIGTPMAPDDLLMELEDDERFVSINLPALNPKPGIKILCPEIRKEEELMLYQKNNPREFAAEMQMIPYSTANSYIKEEMLSKCENPNLQSLDAYKKHDFSENEFIVAGCDVGNRVDPTHIAIFKVNEKEKRMIQIFQILIREMMPSDVKDFMNMLAENFSITKGYWDNTRGELEDRGLEPCWRGHIFGIRNKSTLAQKFEEMLNNQKIQLILDSDQHSQVLSVNGELKAVRTGRAHGEAFTSLILACKAYSELLEGGTQTLGNMQEWANEIENANFNSQNGINFENNKEIEKCPDCGESSGWIKENKLCLICKVNKEEKETEELGRKIRFL